MNIVIGFGAGEKAQRNSKGTSLIDFPQRYVAFDIETTGLDSEFDEIIEIGAIKIENDVLIDQFHSLIKPDDKIDEFITELTGITNDMVADAPNIKEVLPEFVEFIGDNILIGHNVNFDINFIYDNMTRFGFGPLKNNFVDTLRLSKRIVPELAHHRLEDLAQHYNVDIAGHHRSLADVSITNEIFKKLREEVINKYASIDDFAKECRSHHSRIKFSNIKAAVDEINEDSPFYNKCVAITGTLEKMERKEAMQLIANLGGICQDGVNKETNYLILGNNDYNPQLQGKKSNKLIKAEELKLKGKDIEIISENVFYDILDEYR